MAAKSIEDILTAYVSDELLVGEPEPLASDDELLLDGIIDSLGVARLVGFIERRFEASVPVQEVTVENFRTLAILAEYVKGLIGEPQD